jgi:hypothetical protein
MRHACRRGLRALENDPAKTRTLKRELARDFGATSKGSSTWHSRNRPGGFKDSAARLEILRERYERAVTAYPDPLNPGKFIEVVPGNGIRVDAGKVTFRNLLAHNSGSPAWLPLRQVASREKRRDAALNAAFAYPIGTRVVYSDIGLILLGFAMERIGAQSLDQIVRERMTTPLGLTSIGYGPIPCNNVAPTEFYAHQNRRMCGEVHDENA